MFLLVVCRKGSTCVMSDICELEVAITVTVKHCRSWQCYERVYHRRTKRKEGHVKHARINIQDIMV